MQHAGLRVVIIGGVLMTLSALVPILQGIWRAAPQPQPPDHPIAMLLALGFMGLGAILVFQGMWTWLSALDSLSARIDEHQHRAQEGHLKERRLLTMMQHAPESIVVLDAEANCLVEVNPAAETLFQYSSDQLVGEKTLWQLSPPLQPCGTPSKDLMERYLKQAINGTYPVFEWLHLNAKGEPLDCEVTLAQLPSADQMLIRGTIVDISKRRAEAQERENLLLQLAASHKLESVGQLTGGIAHDFNNLLAAIVGNLELLRENITEVDQISLIDAGIDAALHGADLTKNMLAFARKSPLAPAELDLNKIIRSTKNWAGRTLPASVAMETSLLAGLWQVKADPSSTESALLNLLLNAHDAMPDGGRVTIETANVRIDEDYISSRQEDLSPGRYVMLAVSDTGTGIPQELLDTVFDPFFTTKSPGKGTGLGLSMVMGFMHQSGGTVRVYSEPGVGTTFKLYFKALGSDNEGSQETMPHTAPIPTGETRVLVAEDQEQVLDIIVATLTKAGYDVIAAKSGDDAYALFEANNDIDVLLTDIVMPGSRHGPALARDLRQLRPDLPVVFMSGYASEATVHGNGLRPEDIRLMKPVRRSQLLEAIKKATS